MNETPLQNAGHVLSKDGTRIGYLSVGEGPSVLVIPGVLSVAADYAAFARALSEHFSVHTIERRGRGESGPQGDDYSIVKECEDVLAVQAKTGAAFLVGHSYGGLIALEVARNNKTFRKIAVYEPGVSIDGSMPTAWRPEYERKLAEKRNLDALVEFTLADAPRRIQKTPRWLMKLILLVLVSGSRQYRQMLGLLGQNLREWSEIAKCVGEIRCASTRVSGVDVQACGSTTRPSLRFRINQLLAVWNRVGQNASSDRVVQNLAPCRC
jgi:pimeloyl-ACP methyl ester carboxylesterase